MIHKLIALLFYIHSIPVFSKCLKKHIFYKCSCCFFILIDCSSRRATQTPSVKNTELLCHPLGSQKMSSLSLFQTESPLVGEL